MNKSFTALLAIVLLAGAACQRTNNEKVTMFANIDSG